MYILRRLAYPNRLADISQMFKLSPQSLSQIINKTASLIIESHGSLLDDLNVLNWLDRNRLQYYAQVC